MPDGIAVALYYVREVRRPVVHAVFSAVLGLVAGCGEPQEPETPREVPRPAQRRADDALLANVPRGTLGPHLARSPSGSLALWATTGSSNPGWFARALDAKGRPLGPARRVAPSSSEPALARLEPFAAGWLAVWSASSETGSRLASLSFQADGTLRGPPQSLPDAQGTPIWVDIVESGKGGLVFWAERTGSGATLFVRAVDVAGAPTSDATAVGKVAFAWQAVGSDRGAVVALVDESRRLSLVVVSPAGEVTAVHEVPSASELQAEVDLVRVDDRLMVAFTAPAPLDPRVHVGVVDLDGRPLGTPLPALPAMGEQKLIGLVSGTSSAYLVWQDVTQSGDLLKVTRLQGDGAAVGSPVEMRWNETRPVPEFATRGNALRALLWACVESLDCREPAVPVHLGFDEELTPVSVTPLLAGGRVPDLAWNLACTGEQCLSLGALFDDPTKVFIMKEAGKQGQWVLPAWQAFRESPRLGELLSTFEPLPLAAMDALAENEGTLVLWLSEFDEAEPYVVPSTPAPDGRKAPVRAQLWSQWVPNGIGSAGSGEALPAANVISYRARSSSGVSVARGNRANLVVWSAIDGKTPQVFTTLIDAAGKKVAQQMLTRQKGEVSQVAAVAGEGGWYVGWIDDRDGRLLPRLTRIGERLERRLPDQSLGNGTTSSSGFAMTVVGKELWHVRAEVRGRNQSALVLARLDAKNLKLGSEREIVSGDANHHSPRFIGTGPEPLLAFVRETPAESRLQVVALDATTSLAGTPFTLDGTNDVVSFSAECDATGCRAVATTQSDQAPFLEAFTFAPTGASHKARVVATMGATSSLGVVPVLRRNEVWWYDLDTRGRPRVVRGRLAP